MERGASPLLYDILIALVDYYAPLLEGAEQNIRHIEEDLFSEDTRHILNEIALARRDLIAMRRILKPQQEVIRQLARGNWPFIHEELTIYWGDIADHLAQHQAMLDEQIEVVSGLWETIDTLASHHIDEVVRVLTIITVLTLPLSLLSTIFSMNVEFPFRSYLSLFFIVIGAGVTLTADLL
jgi:magnesium transporter